MIDIHNIHQVNQFLSRLEDVSPAAWGKMSPQNMIEHISAIMLFSNGRKTMPLLYPEDKAAALKHYLIDTDNEFPMNFKAPLIGEEPLPYRFENLEVAKGILTKEMENYFNFQESEKDAMLMHPTLGLLDNREWTIFHNKHFAHHFKQFNLLD